MRHHLTATLDVSGLPLAEVPFPCTWDLVEYLSHQRTMVMYDYQASHFTVTFLRLDLKSAQRLLDDWAQVESGQLQSA